MKQPLIIELFDAYHENLNETGNNPEGKEVMLCPLCLTEIKRGQIESGKIQLEHIIPQHSTKEKEQQTRFTQISVKNVRSGLTITCDECNRKKGRELDWYMRKLITPGKKSKNDYPPRSGVAILTYAYLLAFAVLGYEYILDPALEKIRSQFDSPDTIQTNWLQYAYVDLSGPEQPIICNRFGYPFIFDGLQYGPLEFNFWRFHVKLPPIKTLNKSVKIPETITKLAHYCPVKVI